MKSLTNKTNMTIRAAMIVLLSATAATPRSVAPSSHGRGGAPSHSTHHSTPHSAPHARPHGTPRSTPHHVPSAHGRPGGYHHGPAGFRHERPVFERHVRGGYVQRTWVRGGVHVNRYYRPFSYRGYRFHAYAPSRFFAPRFYGWVDAPWGYRVSYRWNWFASPWYVAYRGYFTPYAVYTSAPYWLTDYVVATSLQTSWSAAAVGCNCTYGMTPAVKEAIALEVRRQIAQERAEATGYQASTPTFLDGNSHVMVVSNGTVASANGQACSLSGGDVVKIDGNSPVDGANATVQVVASKGQDCAMGSYVTVALDQLQEMQNQMRESIDQGLETLRAEQGRNGLPAVPADAMNMASAGYMQ